MISVIRREPILFRSVLLTWLSIVLFWFSGEYWFLLSALCFVVWGPLKRRKVVHAQSIRRTEAIDLKHLRDEVSQPPHIHLPDPVTVRTGPPDEETGEPTDEIVGYVCVECLQPCGKGDQDPEGRYYVSGGIDLRWVREHDGTVVLVSMMAELRSQQAILREKVLTLKRADFEEVVRAKPKVRKVFAVPAETHWMNQTCVQCGIAFRNHDYGSRCLSTESDHS